MTTTLSRRRIAFLAAAGSGAALAAVLLGGGALWAQSPVRGTNAQGTPIPTFDPNRPNVTPPRNTPVTITGTPIPGAPTREPAPAPGQPRVMRETNYRSPEMEASERAARAAWASRVPEFVATRSQRVKLGGRDVQLPPDAYVDGQGVVLGEPGGSAPFTQVRRGNAVATIDDRTGKVVAVQEDPARPGQMDFLVEALR